MDGASTQKSVYEPDLARHVPALDGIRGLAILLVIFHHFSFVDDSWRSVGRFAWMGVDLFFVLSGFLITGILYDAKQSPRFFTNFYARRLVRIFPLYYAFVLLRTVLLPAVQQLHRTYPPTGSDTLWYWAFLSNFRFAAHPSSFDTSILDVSWSLAVEEHFYLLWPMVVFLFQRKTLMKILSGVIAAALLIRIGIVLLAPGGIQNYVLTFCRMDSLAVGCFIALACRGKGIAPLASPARRLFPVALLSVVLLMAFRTADWRDDLVQTIGFSLLAVMFGSFLVLGAAAPPSTLLGRFLGSHPMTFFGRYSYALYLVHCPIRDIIRYHFYKPDHFLTLFGSRIPGMIIFAAIALSLSIAAALVSWNLYEKHFLKLKRYFPTSRAKRELANSALVTPSESVPAAAAV